MKKFLIVCVVLLIFTSVGCQQRTPSGQSQMSLTPPDEVTPIEHHTVNNPPLTPEVEPEQPQEMQTTRPPIQEGERLIALTFDDGPAQYTTRILDALEEHGGAATFFVLGYRVENNRSILERMVALGSEVGGHSWNHQDFSRLTEDEIAWQIRTSSEAIAPFVRGTVGIYRPPYGRTNALVRQVSERLGYAIVNWTVDPRDWENRDADYIYNHIMSTVQSGDIVLMHDIYASTAEAAARVIPRLIEEGYRLVTISELLEHQHGEVLPGVIYGRSYDVPIV